MEITNKFYEGAFEGIISYEHPIDTSIKVYYVPRIQNDNGKDTLIKSLKQLKEFDKASIYFLIGDNYGSSHQKYIYIGQVDEGTTSNRMEAHTRDRLKDNWDKAIIFTNDKNFGSMLNYFEMAFYDIGKTTSKSNGVYYVDNRNVTATKSYDNFISNRYQNERGERDFILKIIKLLRQLFGCNAFSSYVEGMPRNLADFDSKHKSNQSAEKIFNSQNEKYGWVPEYDTPDGTVFKICNMLINQIKSDIEAKKFLDKEAKPKKLKDIRFLDIACKHNAEFLQALYKILKEELKSEFKTETALASHIINNQLYGLCLKPSTMVEAQMSMYGELNYKGNIRYIEDYVSIVTRVDLRAKTVEGEKGELNDKLSRLEFDNGNGENMTFDVIIGNPPYHQETNGGNRDNAYTPIYDRFIYSAELLNPSYMGLIIPSRFLSGGTIVLDRLRSRFVDCKRIQQIHYYDRSHDIFENADIMGGGYSTFYIIKTIIMKLVNFIIIGL